MNVPKDHLWKLAFRLMMQQIVEFFFLDKYDEVDWTKEIVFLDKELNTIQADSRPKNRIADVLVMLTLKNGKPLYIFLHIEVQGYFDADYALRVHQMGYRIEDKMGSKPVTLSIFTDNDPNFHPKEYYVEIWGSSSRSVFNTYKVMEHPPITYKNPDNPVALIMEIVYTSTQIEKATDREIMKLFVGLTQKLVLKGYSKEYIYLMKNFIEAHVIFADSRKYRIFEKKMKEMVAYETTEEILSFLNFEKRLEIAQQEKQIAQQEKQKALLDARRERKEKQRERKEKELARKEEERARELAVLSMLNQSMPNKIIASILKISNKEILAIQLKYKDNNPITQLMNGHSQN